MYAHTNDELTGAAGVLQYKYPLLSALLSQIAQPVSDAAAARAGLLRVVQQLRDIDVAMGGGHTRACDVLHMHALTKVSLQDACQMTSCIATGAGLPGVAAVKSSGQLHMADVVAVPFMHCSARLGDLLMWPQSACLDSCAA
jgi:hypothetical protein